MKWFILLLSALTLEAAQQYTTPVPILKQINKHNEDGSYSYGYEAADGTYRIESKYANGEVYGKYGYKDDSGKLREIEYGATKRGFEPQGNDINIPPPTLDDKNLKGQLGPNEEDDGQYREDPAIYYKDEKYNQNSLQQPDSNKESPQTFQLTQYQQPLNEKTPFNFDDFINAPFKLQTQPKYQPQYQIQYQPQYQTQYQQPYQPPQKLTSYYNPQSSYYNSQPSYYNPQPSYYNAQPSYYNQPNYYNPAYSQPQTSPVSNVNMDLGSYSINYR